MVAEPGSERRKRRSQRFPHAVSVLLSSTEPGMEFQETCKTKDVSSHGCQIRSTRKLTPGQSLELKIPESGRHAKALVVRVRPDLSTMAWEAGLELAEPANVWGFEFLPRTLHWPADLPAPPIELTPPSPKQEKEQPRASGALPHKELEERSFEILHQVTDQITKNAQFALNTVEESLREMADAIREELGRQIREQWADPRQNPAFREALEEIRRQNQEMIANQRRDFQVHLEDSLRAGLQALLEHLRRKI